ncbi:endonuclease/exonuclease/phosphatase family protein [Sulfitobacter geojensis]|uniref:endonuclease/exonuclease/phosphatase family protein n=1 Tax=Sulfitobacter geojensis TaxID=1342299 RepID=UPI00249138B8|nr:endonuclease/exonuclease/phosphatase family protein [Sulfitobacter geojensis]
MIALCLCLFSSISAADTLRVATYNTELSRKGPGLLLRDLAARKDPQLLAVLAVIANANADVIALQGIDYDLQNLALAALADTLGYPHFFAAPPNAGLMTPLDLDGNGRLGEAADAQGYGRFFGQGSMAILSQHPILTDEVQDFSTLLWRDLPMALLPQADGKPFPSAEAQAIQRLSSHGHWAVPIQHPTMGRVTILTYHATPPVFDGPEDRNGKRNHDETAFWNRYLDGTFGTVPKDRFVLMGDANLDPNTGDGIGRAIDNLLSDPRLQDPLPMQPTVTFSQTGPMRVDYVLPSADWRVTAAQVTPAIPDASRHSLVWVDLAR